MHEMTNLHDEFDQCAPKEPDEAPHEERSSRAVKRKGGRPRKEDLIQNEAEELSLEAKRKRDKRRRDNLLAAARYRHKKDERINELRKGNEQLTQRLKAQSEAFAKSYATIRELQQEIARLESMYKRFVEENLDLRTELNKVTRPELESNQRVPAKRDTEQSCSSSRPQVAQSLQKSVSPSVSTPVQRADKPVKGVVVIPATTMMRNFLIQNPSRSMIQLASAVPLQSELPPQTSRPANPSCPCSGSALDVRILKQNGQRREQSDQCKSKQEKIKELTLLSQISTNSSLSRPSSSPPSSPPRLVPSLNDSTKDASSSRLSTESLSTLSPSREQRDVDSHHYSMSPKKSPDRICKKRQAPQQTNKQHRSRVISESCNKSTVTNNLIGHTPTTPTFLSLMNEPRMFLNTGQPKFIPILSNMFRQRTSSEQSAGTPPQQRTSSEQSAGTPSQQRTSHNAPVIDCMAQSHLASCQSSQTLSASESSQPHCKDSTCCDSVSQGQLKLPIRRDSSVDNTSITSLSAHDADDVLSFLRRDQPNPYSQNVYRLSTHRKQRPRLDDSHKTAHQNNYC